MSQDPLEALSKKIEQAHREGAAAAKVAAEALAEAKNLVGWRRWSEWVRLNTKLTDQAVDHYLRQGEAGGCPPGEARTVICGWCSFARRERGQPVKLLAGPADGSSVVHGVCEDCESALESKLSAFETFERKPFAGDENLLEDLSASDWDVACSSLKAAFFHADEVLSVIRPLQSLTNPGLAPGVTEVVVELVTSFEAIKRLASELVLISLGHDFDPDLFSGRSG